MVVLIRLIKGPIDELAVLYDSRFAIHTLSGETSLQLFAMGVLLGLLGSWVAVGRHLKTIEPK